MRFATYHQGGYRRAGIVEKDVLYPLPEGITVLDLVRVGLKQALEVGAHVIRSAEGVALGELRLAPPLEPPSIRDFVAFEEHVEGIVKSVPGDGRVAPEWYEAPTFYFTNPHCLVGTGDPVPIPPGCQRLDYELEVALVIDREGSNLAPEVARDHIFGYAIFNDWSARDLQSSEMRVGLGPAKGKDFASTLGPWLVTADELEDYRDEEGFLRLELMVEVNGVETGRDLLSNMAWTFEELVAYASRGTRVCPGDVLASGTCGNGGCLAELWGRRGIVEPRPLRPGDTVRMVAEGIGAIVNTVVPGPAALPIPSARRRPRLRTAGRSRH